MMFVEDFSLIVVAYQSMASQCCLLQYCFVLALIVIDFANGQRKRFVCDTVLANQMYIGLILLLNFCSAGSCVLIAQFVDVKPRDHPRSSSTTCPGWGYS